MRTDRLTFQNVNIRVIQEINSKAKPPDSSEKVRRRRPGQTAEDLTGLESGIPKVPERVQNLKRQVRRKCLCDCKAYIAASTRSLQMRLKQSCGCLRQRGPNRKILTGKKIGFKKKIFYLGSDDWRKMAEAGEKGKERIRGAFPKSCLLQKKMDGRSPCRGGTHSFQSDASRESGKIMICNSMRGYGFLNTG